MMRHFLIRGRHGSRSNSGITTSWIQNLNGAFPAAPRATATITTASFSSLTRRSVSAMTSATTVTGNVSRGALPSLSTITNSLTPQMDGLAIDRRRQWFSSSASQVASASSSSVSWVVPPNLTFDSKSSFAPKEQQQQNQKGKRAPTPIASVDADGDSLKELDSSAVVDEDTPSPDHDGDEDEDDEEILFLPQQSQVEARPVIPLPDRLKSNVYYGKDGTVTGTIWLEETVFGLNPIRMDLMKQAVDYIRAKIRGKRKNITKTISQVSGSGKKVRRQKGTGAARAGHSRPNHWRGGAKAHGPKGKIQDYGAIKMTKKMRQLALSSVLSQKLKEGNLILMDDTLCLDSHKTQPWSNLLENSFGIGRNGTSALIVDHYPAAGNDDSDSQKGSSKSQQQQGSYNGVPINLWVASSNIPKIKVVNPSFVNVYEVLKREKLVLSLEAVKVFEGRLKR